MSGTIATIVLELCMTVGWSIGAEVQRAPQPAGQPALPSDRGPNSTASDLLADARSKKIVTEGTNYDRGAVLSIWRSTNATTEQRINAVRLLLPVGTPAEVIPRLLGTGVWNRAHGILLPWQGPGDPPAEVRTNSSADFHWLEYPAQNGDVTLLFKHSTNGLLFQHVGFVPRSPSSSAAGQERKNP